MSYVDYEPRLTIPEKSNKYYIRLNNGGYNTAILGKPLYCNGSVLSNCVGYAIGRFNEIGDNKGMRYLYPCNAKDFIKYKGACKTGKTPKLGACIVWDGGPSKCGHVAIVEQINKDGSIVTSESGYGSVKYFWTRTRKNDGNWGQGTSYKFLGFIYNPAVIEYDMQKIKIDYNGKTVECQGVNIDGTNCIRLRDLQDVFKIANVSYDSKKKLPIVTTK